MNTKIFEIDDQNYSDYEIIDIVPQVPASNSGFADAICKETCRFERLDNLANIKFSSLINVKGVIVSVDNETKLLSSKIYEGKPLKLKNFKLGDESGHEINVAIWGAQAESFSYKPGSILKIESVKLSNFDGFSLSIQRNSKVVNMTAFEKSSSLKNYWENNYLNKIN